MVLQYQQSRDCFRTSTSYRGHDPQILSLVEAAGKTSVHKYNAHVIFKPSIITLDVCVLCLSMKALQTILHPNFIIANAKNEMTISHLLFLCWLLSILKIYQKLRLKNVSFRGLVLYRHDEGALGASKIYLVKKKKKSKLPRFYINIIMFNQTCAICRVCKIGRYR